MRRPSMCSMAAFCGLAVFTASSQRGSAQQPSAASSSGAVTPRAEIYPTLDDAFLRWPLPAGAERYGAIDGKCMHKDVVQQAQISRRYHDAGHPKFWGRITGTSSDAESAQWLAAKFKATGLSDVRIQPLDLEPQWMPQTWEAVITGGGKTCDPQIFPPNTNSLRLWPRARVAGEPARGLWSTWPGGLSPWKIEQLGRLLRLAAGEREAARRGQSSSPKCDARRWGTRLGPRGSLERNVKFGFT